MLFAGRSFSSVSFDLGWGLVGYTAPVAMVALGRVNVALAAVVPLTLYAAFRSIVIVAHPRAHAVGNWWLIETLAVAIVSLLCSVATLLLYVFWFDKDT